MNTTHADIAGLWPLPGAPDVVIVGKLSRLVDVHDWTLAQPLPEWCREVVDGHVAHGVVRVNGRRLWVAVCVQRHDEDWWAIADFCAAESLDSEEPLASGDVLSALTESERCAVLDRFDTALNRRGWKP